jgi:hypothetical protein
VPSVVLRAAAIEAAVVANVAVSNLTSQVATRDAGTALALAEREIVGLSNDADSTDAVVAAMDAVRFVSTDQMTACGHDAEMQRVLREHASCVHTAEALAVATELVRRWRERLQIPPSLQSSGVLEFVRSLPYVQHWSPTSGTLQLRHSTLSKPQLSGLKALADTMPGLLTSRGGGKSKSVLVFVFNTLRLWDLLKTHR